MQLSDEIKRASITGTSEGEALLRTIAIQSLQGLAGYTPPTLSEPSYLHQADDTRSITPRQTASQLYLMLLGDFQFVRCLPDWCLLVAEHQMRIPSELIPRLLNSPYLKLKWRAVALLAMGRSARWIADHHRNSHAIKQWDWVLETPPPTIASIRADIALKSQEKIQEYDSIEHLTAFYNSLVTHQYLWSDALAEFILHHLNDLLTNVPPDRWQLDVNRLHLLFAYYAPLKYHPLYSQYLQKMRVMKLTRVRIKEITVYRHKLRDIIRKDAKPLGNLSDKAQS